MCRCSEGEEGDACSQDGADHGNGGGASRLRLVRLGIAVGFAVALELHGLGLPSDVGGEAVRLLQHHVVNAGELKL